LDWYNIPKNKKGIIMNHGEWKERFSHRNDISSRITHLTNGSSPDEAFENLINILDEQKIIGGLGYVNGKTPVVCLQESPLSSIAENLLYEKYLRDENMSEQHRYRAFGLRFAKPFVYSKGGRPVIYGDVKEMKAILPESEYWRIVDLKLQDLNNFVDWSHEREWRVKKELKFKYSQTEVIVPSRHYYKKIIEYCEEKERMDILKGINGIITLDSIYC
jgi:hypothetical protein